MCHYLNPSQFLSNVAHLSTPSLLCLSPREHSYHCAPGPAGSADCDGGSRCLHLQTEAKVSKCNKYRLKKERSCGSTALWDIQLGTALMIKEHLFFYEWKADLFTLAPALNLWLWFSRQTEPSKIMYSDRHTIRSLRSCAARWPACCLSC